MGSLLLPLFFVVTGLSVRFRVLSGQDMVLLALLLLVAVSGKFGAGYVMSRLGGLDPRESATVGALLNTRGLTELVVLNLGLTSGLIHRDLFTLLVLVALVTTVMAGPLLDWLGIEVARVEAVAPGVREKPSEAPETA